MVRWFWRGGMYSTGHCGEKIGGWDSVISCSLQTFCGDNSQLPRCQPDLICGRAFIHVRLAHQDHQAHHQLQILQEIYQRRGGTASFYETLYFHGADTNRPHAVSIARVGKTEERIFPNPMSQLPRKRTVDHGDFMLGLQGCLHFPGTKHQSSGNVPYFTSSLSLKISS